MLPPPVRPALPISDMSCLYNYSLNSCTEACVCLQSFLSDETVSQFLSPDKLALTPGKAKYPPEPQLLDSVFCGPGPES